MPQPTQSPLMEQTLAPPPAGVRRTPTCRDAASASLPSPRRRELMDELVEEVLLRLPPADPGSLVRAAVVCKRWRRLVSDPGFRRRFLEFHRTPPVLGFFYLDGSGSSAFAPTASSFPPLAARHGGGLRVVDARHGRVLLRSNQTYFPSEGALVVWDPITDQHTKLPLLPQRFLMSWTASVLCAASLDGTCDHVDCNHGDFLVFFVASGHEELAYVYSSETGAWSQPIATHLQWPYLPHRAHWWPSVLAGDALYFLFQWENIVLMATEDGRLGFAKVVDSKLYLWTRTDDDDPSGYQGWKQSRAIQLKKLLPVGADSKTIDVDVVAIADGAAIVFLGTRHDIFAFDPKSDKVTMAWKDTSPSDVYPYVSFYTPAMGGTSIGERPRASSSRV
ncbi:hypothetical protein EJB05_14028, partial [Eragrostis curvula]